MVEVIYGAEYAGYDSVVRGFAVMFLIGALMIPTDAGLFAIERSDVRFKGEVGSALIGCSAGAFLIWEYGLVGAVTGMVAGMVAASGYRCVMFWFRREARGAVARPGDRS